MHLNLRKKCLVNLPFLVAFLISFSQPSMYFVPGLADSPGVSDGVTEYVTPAVSLQSVYSEPIHNVVKGKQVVISISVVNENQTDISMVTFIEIRKSDGVTENLYYQTGEIEPLGMVEIGVSWLPTLPDTYTLRAFCVTELANPLLLSPIASLEVTVL